MEANVMMVGMPANFEMIKAIDSPSAHTNHAPLTLIITDSNRTVDDVTFFCPMPAEVQSLLSAKYGGQQVFIIPMPPTT